MRRGRRAVSKKQTKVKKKMTSEEIEKKKKNIVKSFFVIFALIIIFVIFMIANHFIVLDHNKKTNLVINNKNVTSNLKNDIVIENNIIYLSQADIKNFFDKHIYNDNDTNQIITTYEKKIAAIGFEKNKITINGSNKEIYSHAIKKDEIVYLPISEMTDVYDIEISNIEKTKVVTMDSLEKEQKKAIGKISNNIYNENDRELRMKLLKAGECVDLAAQKRMPHYIAEYLYDLAVITNTFYQNNNISKLKDENQKSDWLGLLNYTYDVMEKLLSLLVIKIPSEM